MKINEINFGAMETVRKKCIKFAKDNNTVVKPWKTLYRLQDVTQDEAHENLYLEIIPLDYRTDYKIWNDLGVICVDAGWVGAWEIKEISRALSNDNYLGIDGFLRRLKEAETRKIHINKADIEVCALLGYNQFAAHYAEYREKRNAEREVKRQETLERLAKERAEELKKRREEAEKTIVDAENAIRNRQTLKNEKFEGSTIILQLMKKHGVNVPLRTQGWINQGLSKICFLDNVITYAHYTTSGSSEVFYKYLRELEQKILQSV